ncbi:c-type cytochrome [Hydrogenophaga sp. PBL-H3]|uniref:c-type cytochrome n=1 Tax=Hydrogenophaga sp. PBL-H3 TaxID=434010 RepID=UPI00131F73A8|nr:cytochrome c [Hydrogenophaga sp. PBL-H3]QHE75094.1 cytochrome c [Hydrogenophaga sp. PBL-H3]QHE79521.1 cytochrome c [Hydrogenophaga sp. PBL-H3]
MRISILIAAALSVGTASAADPMVGRTKAASACAVCHGPTGMSMMPNAPHLAGQPAIYLVEQLKNYRSGKRTHEVMGVIAKPLTDTEIDDLAAWYSSLQISVQVP